MYPSHFRPVEVHFEQEGFPSSHLIRRILHVMHPDLTLGAFLLCRFWTLVIFYPAVTITSSMDSIEETMMRMSYSQQAVNLDSGEDVRMCRSGQDGGAGKNADQVEGMIGRFV